MDDYDRKLRAAIAEMKQAGLKVTDRPHWTLRLAQGVGLRLRPRLYASFWDGAARLGVPFALLTTALNLVLVGVGPNGGWEGVAFKLLFYGLFFGLGMMAVLRWRERRLNLSPWEEL